MKYVFSKKKLNIKIFTTLALIVLCLTYSIKTVPNYSKKSGYDFILKYNQNKYSQGYCLTENRILSNEEILKKGLSQFFQKEIALYKNVQNYRIHKYGSNWEVYSFITNATIRARLKLKCDITKPDIGYYSLESIKTNEFMTEFFKKYNPDKRLIGLLELFFCDFKAKKISAIKNIIIKNNIAYFSKPTVLLSYHEGFIIYLKKFLLEKKNKEYILKIDGMYLPEGYGMVNIKQSFEYYNKKDSYYYKIDNCGNIDYNIEEIYEDIKEATGG